MTFSEDNPPALDANRAGSRRRARLWFGGVITLVVITVSFLWIFCGIRLLGPAPQPTESGPDFGTVTLASPIRVEGAEAFWYSDSIIVTISEALAADGWTPVLSDGSCHVLSPGANTQFIGADGVQVTSFDQTTATHIILTQSAEAIDCGLEYTAPTRGSSSTFTTPIKTDK